MSIYLSIHGLPYLQENNEVAWYMHKVVKLWDCNQYSLLKGTLSYMHITYFMIKILYIFVYLHTQILEACILV